ncbi:hypothetical protein DID88_008836 [Monilinia fructigena]|uniref:Uncharacterized protein n=1 Tax=Monilinia fructigena TaxID=38457 RepID=A0A395J7M0_9HELO|nr:hypothetical protein DID88_008836 [Monilinia fructigena]
MSRRLFEATEDAILEGGRKSRGKKQGDVAVGQAWTGQEATEDTVLRMLDDDARKPLSPGLRGPGKIPSPVVDLRLKREPKQRPGQRLANARDKTSIYAISKDGQMTEEEREEMRRDLKERFTPGARAMPNSIRGLAALANERIEDAIARGQFKEQMRTAEMYAQSEAVHNPKKRAVEQIAVPTNVTDDPVMVKIVQEVPNSSSNGDPIVQISMQTKENETDISKVALLEEDKRPDIEPLSTALPPPFRIPAWEEAEQSYLTLAITDLNKRELKSCYADVAPQLAEAIKERATRPARDLVEKIGHTPGGVMERFGSNNVKVYDSKRPLLWF